MSVSRCAALGQYCRQAAGKNSLFHIKKTQSLTKVVFCSFVFLFLRFFEFVFYLNFKMSPIICHRPRTTLKLSRQNNIGAPDVCILSVLPADTKFKLSLFLVHLQPSIQDWQSFKKNEPKSQLKTAFLFFLFWFWFCWLLFVATQGKVAFLLQDRKKKSGGFHRLTKYSLSC